jgi:hypothetical protein
MDGRRGAINDLGQMIGVSNAKTKGFDPHAVPWTLKRG